jgi:hypothetical protein
LMLVDWCIRESYGVDSVTPSGEDPYLPQCP